MRMVALASILIFLTPMRAFASCNVSDTAPIVSPDRRACLPQNDETRFIHSTGGGSAAYFAHGYACLSENRASIAVSKFAMAHPLQTSEHPYDLRPLLFEAVAYDRLGKRDQVARVAVAARVAASRSAPYLSIRPLDGATQFSQGHYLLAFQFWQSLWQQPYNRPMYEDANAIQPFHDGLDLAAAGHYCAALRVLVPVASKSPMFGDIRFATGAAYYAVGDRKNGRFEMEAAVINTPAQPGWWAPGEVEWTALNILLAMPR